MKTGIKTYFLPRELRPELRKIWRIPFFNGQKEILKKFQQFIKKKRFKKIITVGDYCSLTLPSDSAQGKNLNFPFLHYLTNYILAPYF